MEKAQTTKMQFFRNFFFGVIFFFFTFCYNDVKYDGFSDLKKYTELLREINTN